MAEEDDISVSIYVSMTAIEVPALLPDMQLLKRMPPAPQHAAHYYAF